MSSARLGEGAAEAGAGSARLRAGATAAQAGETSTLRLTRAVLPARDRRRCLQAGTTSTLRLTRTVLPASLPAFQPVTDQMLQSPDPGYWLHWRRTLDG